MPITQDVLTLLHDQVVQVIIGVLLFCRVYRTVIKG